MSTIWRKAIRDFWQERARTALVVLAIALGISAFAAVMSSYAILTRELDLGYLATNPASAVMRLDSIDDETVKAILEIKDYPKFLADSRYEEKFNRVDTELTEVD